MKTKEFLSLISVLLLHPAASANTLIFEASLDGPSEFPPNASPGTGSALVTYDDVAHTLSINASFQDLIGTTTVAHIHATTALPFEGAVGVAVTPGTLPGFPAGLTAGTYNTLSDIDLTLTTTYTAGFLGANGGTAAGAEAGLLEALQTGRAYFNIHSTAFPGGEIRGFLTPVPETAATAPLLALGVMAMVGFARMTVRTPKPPQAQ